MGPMDLHFNFRDIFRAPRLALSGKKIWMRNMLKKRNWMKISPKKNLLKMMRI